MRCSDASRSIRSMRLRSTVSGSVSWHHERLADRNRHVRERLRNHPAIPAPRRPVPAGLDVKRQDRMAGRAGEPHGAGLGDPCRAARPIDREGGRVPRSQLPPHLHQRAAAAARRRSAGGPEPEPRHQPRDPLAVEVLAGHRDDAALAPVERGREDPAVPERQDRRPALLHQRVVVLRAFDASTSTSPRACRRAGAPARQSRRPWRAADGSGTLYIANSAKIANIANIEILLLLTAVRLLRSEFQRRPVPLPMLAIVGNLGNVGNAYMPSYCGPPPPSGGTQSMIW